MSDSSKILDLDALIPDSVSIKFGGETILVQPPKTADVLRLGFLGQKIETAGELADPELEKLVVDLTGQITKIVPELQSKELNIAQLLKLVAMVNDMTIPPDTKELEARGIKVGDSSKKAL